MWPFKKKTEPVTQVPPDQIHYSQLDITETFSDNQRLEADEWVSTTPLNKMTPNGQGSGLPPEDASDEEVYTIAAEMSQIRDHFAIANDGVYCPVCHVANTQLTKLRTPCPECGRELLRFGWD